MEGSRWKKILSIGSALSVTIMLQWYLSGGYLPLGIAKPNRGNISHQLKEKFPNIPERAINSAMMHCDRAEWIDWGGMTYERFISKFQTLEAYQEYQNTKKCPESFSNNWHS